MLTHLFLGLVLFLSSAGGLTVEIVAGRLIAPYVGMSLYTWTAIIAVVLAGLSVGHWIGGLLAGAAVDRSRGLMRLAVALALTCVTTLLVLVVLSDLAIALVTSGLGQVTIVIILTTTLFLLPSLFVGIVAPIVTKLAVDAAPDRVGDVLGRMFAIGTVGSIGGTLASGYLFISWVGSSGTLIAVAVLYFILAAACAVLSGRRGGVAIVAVLLVSGGILATAGATRGAFASRCTVESDYFCIQIDDFSQLTGRPSTLMALDNLVHSINDRDDPSLLYSPYIHFVDEYARRRFELDRRDGEFRAFFIGGGGYSLPRSWAATVEGARLLVAEIDPAVTDAAVDRMWLDPTHPALEIAHRDARALLQSLPPEPSFHVVFGDAFHDISIPTHLVSQEFHAEIAKRLRPDGFYVVNVVDAHRNPRFLAALVGTLERDFPAVEIWVEAEQTDGDADVRATYIVVASAGVSGPPVLRSVFGIARSWGRMPTSALPDTDVVLTDDFAPVERLLGGVLFSAASPGE
jgi:MFS family permease